MAATTDYLGLTKPAQEDYYNVEDWNTNSDIIDQYVAGLSGEGGVIPALQAAVAAAAKGLKLKGAVNYYSDLPANPQEGDAYTVLYAGSSGTDPLGLEYAWASYNNTLQWVPIGVDPSVFARADDVAAAEAKQNTVLADLLNGQPKNISRFMHNGGTWYKITFTPNKVTGALQIQTDGASNGYKGFRILGTDADNVGWQYGVPIPRGTYKLTGLPSGASSSTFRYLLGIASSSTATRTSTSVYDDYEFTVSNDTTRIDLSAYVAQGANLSSGVTLHPMLCRIEASNISDAFVPWHPPLDEMWAAIQALQT